MFIGNEFVRFQTFTHGKIRRCYVKFTWETPCTTQRPNRWLIWKRDLKLGRGLTAYQFEITYKHFWQLLVMVYHSGCSRGGIRVEVTVPTKPKFRRV